MWGRRWRVLQRKTLSATTVSCRLPGWSVQVPATSSFSCDIASLRLSVLSDVSLTPVIERIGRKAVNLVEDAGRWGHFMADMARAVPDVATWGRLLFVQMRRIGVDSLPVALFIAAFTGVILALQASYTFNGTVPAVSRWDARRQEHDARAGPDAGGLGARRARGSEHGRRTRDDEGHRASGRTRDPGIRPAELSGCAARARRDGDVSARGCTRHRGSALSRDG